MRWIWARRRWFYGAYMLVAVLRIPARTRFQLGALHCDTRLTLENAGLSMTKIPHVILFGIFFLITVIQFERIDRRSLSLSVLATAALGLLVELEEGATKTGNCRLTDALPDAFGALVVMGVLMAAMMLRYHYRREAH